MKDFVSIHRTGAATMVALTSLACVIFAPFAMPLTGLVWGTLALSGAALLWSVAGRSIGGESLTRLEASSISPRIRLRRQAPSPGN